MKRTNQPFRVLIVDDCPDDISQPYLLSFHLGCEVELALDGMQALDSIDKSQFDLIILDWNMPAVSGPAFLKSMRTRGLGMNVVQHSGNELGPAEQEVISDYRVLDYWPKPMSPIDFLRRMKKIREQMGR